eukprot:gene1718-1878_t
MNTILLFLIFTYLWIPLIFSVKIDYNKESSEKFGEILQRSFVLTEDQRKNWYSTLQDSDSVIASNMNSICNQPSLRRFYLWGEGKVNMTIDASIGASLLSVAVLQCRDGVADNPVTVDINLRMLNPRPHSEDGHSHLPIEYVTLTRVYEGFVIAYSLMLAAFLAQVYFATREGTSFLLHIHYLFFATLVLKIVWIALEYDYLYEYNHQGKEPKNVLTAASFFEAWTTALALNTLLVLSLGWSVLRERLSDREARMVNISYAFYFLFAIFTAGCPDGSAVTCQGLSLVTFVFKNLYLLAILVSMNFTVTQLRAMLTHTPWVPSTPLQYARCKQFQVFRAAFIIYLLLPTAYLLIEVTTYTWRDSWITTVLTELTEFFFFLHIGVTFSPLYEPLLMRSFDGTMHRAD